MLFIFKSVQIRLAVALIAMALVVIACTASAKNEPYFGKTKPPEGQVLRYVSGSEPESLDPQIGTGQPEARIYMALYDGLCEYDPKTAGPIPSIAESWEPNQDNSEFVFHLRKNARFSNGDPITAQDFLYSFRRALSPELAARYAYIAYYIKYAEAYNNGSVFVRDPRTGEFLLERDFSEPADNSSNNETVSTPSGAALATESSAQNTPFHEYIHSPTRVTLPGDQAGRAKALAKNAKLKAAVEGKEFVPVKAEDIGVEAVDDYTLRVTLGQRAPFFISLMPHQLFRAVHRKTIERFHEAWTQPGNIVTSGAFKVEAWVPYDRLVVVRDPMFWDAARVQLSKIIFYPLQDNTTIMNLYKAGAVDAVQNHSVPASWLDHVRSLRDYMGAPEVTTEYYQFNTTKKPMDDVRVRRAFNMSINKVALAEWRKVAIPWAGLTPKGIFPGYPQPAGEGYDPQKAKQLLAEAGYRDASGNYDPKKFPVDQVELTTNSEGSNVQIAEFIQAQWKQNLGITIPIKSMEFKTFLVYRANLEYKGIARSGWVGDYMDPNTFLNIFTTRTGDNGTGWYDPKYVAMINEANSMLDSQKRLQLLAQAEAYLLDAQPIIPLFSASTNWTKKPYVKGMYPNPQTLHPWKYVYIEYDTSKWDQGVPDMTPGGAD
ncbi:MAG: hypothetical protein AUG51_15340 [Acidobacteria bacterium 13_1_20CM_3_53_8]|nr:MAG: hypothetical protein AUG51_15340 [Acidobacteria bacterium 13_1_20CM_3_53_8]